MRTRKGLPIAGWTRRSFLQSVPAVLAWPRTSGETSSSLQDPAPTRFQIACMTLPYSAFPLERALKGIAESGFDFVAWGTRHREASGERVPVLELDAPPSEAKKLADRCRDLGLTPLLMFSGIGVEQEEAVEGHQKRIRQAAAAGIPQLLTFGSTRPGHYDRWIRNLKAIGPMARDAGVIVVVKQHGGETATGKDTLKIIREVDDGGIKINYDAGNVLDYMNVDPIPDIRMCAAEVRSFSIKDHRNFPRDEDCGPGFGEIDHYKLLAPVAYTGRTIPLAFENIFAPLVPRPQTPDEVDRLARRAREYLETVIQGLHSVPAAELQQTAA